MTNDGMLSQEEIDALLNIGTEDSDNDNDTPDIETNEALSTIEIDTLGEIGNISFGSSATSLSTLLNQKVEITVPKVSVIDKKEFAFTFEPVSIQVNYIQGFTGKNVFIIKANDAAIISDIMLGGDGTTPEKQLSEIHLSAVQEAMNQMMGAAATSMSTIFNKKVDISPPSIIDHSANNDEILDEEAYVKISFRLRVGNLIDSNMMQLMPIRFARQVVNELLNGGADVEQQATSEAAATMETVRTENNLDPQHAVNDFTSHVTQAPTSENNQNPQFIGDNRMQNQASVQEASFSDFEKVTLKKNEQRNLDMLLDIPLNVTVELGRTKRAIRDILDFSTGSIIELDKLAGEPVDILVNKKLIATGEVVVIDENFGVRVTDIISKSDRLMKLK